MLWRGFGGVVGDSPVYGESKIADGNYPAVSFDGNDALRRTGDAATNIGNGVFTLECWFKITGNSVQNGAGLRYGSLYSQGEGNANRFDFHIYGNSTTTGTGFVVYTGVSSTDITWNVTIPQNQWHHVAVVRETVGASLKCYFNGELLTVSTNSLGGNTLSNGTPSAANIGRLNYPNYEHYFVGDISNLRFVSGTPIYTENFTPIAPLEDVSGTIYLMCASDVAVTDETSSNNRDFVNIGDPTLTTATLSYLRNLGGIWNLSSTYYNSMPLWQGSANKFNLVGNPIDIYGWVGRDGAITTGLNCNISRDASVTDSPFGGIPLSMTITGDGNDPQIGTYNNVNGYTWNIAPAESGQIWEMRVLAKASQAGLVDGQFYIFGAGADGLWANTGGDIKQGIVQFDTVWKEFKTTFTINNLDVRYIQVRLDGPQSDAIGETVWWDGLQVYKIS